MQEKSSPAGDQMCNPNVITGNGGHANLEEETMEINNLCHSQRSLSKRSFQKAEELFQIQED